MSVDMNKNKAFFKMVDTINEFGQCTVYLEDSDEIVIEPAENFIGGEEGYYMCDVLGNIQYDNLEEICEDVLELIDDRKIESIEVD